MVASDRIKTKYIELLELVKNDAEQNSSICEYFNYLDQFKENFTRELSVNNIEELKEFIRGANRYSDEFVFSEKAYFLIRKVINELYEILNTLYSQI